MEEALQALVDALNEHVLDVNVRRKIWVDIIKEFDEVDSEALVAVSKSDDTLEEAYDEYIHGHQDRDEYGDDDLDVAED